MRAALGACLVLAGCSGGAERDCVAEARDYDAVSGRRPHAGLERFYRLDPDEFCETTGEVLDAVEPAGAIAGAKVVISPHAGWQYSGIVTASVLDRVEVPDLVFLIGTNHTGAGEDGAVWPSRPWAFPFGDVPVDADTAERLAEAVDAFTLDEAAHLEEHSNEVQVVWLTRENPNVRIVPVALKSTSDVQALLQAGDQLAAFLETVEAPYLVVATTDLTHYAPPDVVEARDAMMVDRMAALDPEGLHDLVYSDRAAFNMCGPSPTVVALQAARGLGATEAEVVMRRHSGDTAPSDSVVGYAGVVLF